MRAAILVLVLAVLAHAAPFDRSSIAMMPGLDRQERNALNRAHGVAAREEARVYKRITAIDARLEKRPAKQEAQKLSGERKVLEARIKAIHGKLERDALAAGLTADQFARLTAMPRGKLREERYNHSVVLEAENLSVQQQALLRTLVAATNAAQSASLAQHEYLVKGFDKADKIMRRRIDATCSSQRRDIERRFWRAVYYALTPKQMRGVRALLSPRYSGIPELRRQLYLLPDVSPSQATRIQARFTECESENAADQAEVRRIRMALKDKSISKEQRSQLYQRNGAAYARIGELNQARRAAVRATLTPAQRDALDAIPPRLNIGERSRAPWEVLRFIKVRPEQRVRITALQKQSGKTRRDINKASRAEQADLMGAGVGPESPQMMTMEMARQGARGETIAHYRELGRRLFVEILEPNQVAGWVVAPTLSQ